MRRALILVLLSAIAAPIAFPCQVLSVIEPVELVKRADLVLRVTAVDYARLPASIQRTDGTPDSTITFRIEERVKGAISTSELILPGYLTQIDDYNDGTVPYRFVRPDGRAGSCFANTYREGAQYLLFLKLVNGVYTANWTALAPVNEQIRGADDAWVKWVRTEVQAHQP